jgi:glutamine amidotransferase
MYLVHSYFVPLIPETIAQSNYNGNYTVALQKDNFYGVQFHPEKSSKAGQKLLENFLAL